MLRWLQRSATATAILFLFRLWLGWQWFMAGLAKIAAPDWTGQQAGSAVAGFAKAAVVKAAGEKPEVQGWFAHFLNGMVIPNADVFGFVAAWGEVFVGIALLVGCFTGFAAAMGALMNVMYLLAGANSLNPQMLLISGILLVAAGNAGQLGFDFVILPWLRESSKKLQRGIRFNIRGGFHKKVAQ